jgi:hypothetical protein
VTLEFGGNPANVMFADADLDRALVGDCAPVIRELKALRHTAR